MYFKAEQERELLKEAENGIHLIEYNPENYTGVNTFTAGPIKGKLSE